MNKSIFEMLTRGGPRKMALRAVVVGAGGGGLQLLWGMGVGWAVFAGFQFLFLSFLTLIAIRVERRLNHTHTAASKASERASYAQAMPMLYQELDVPYPLPVLDEWTLEPSGLLLLNRLVNDRDPSVIVEFGSGSSTAPLALLANRVEADFYSIEEDEQWANRTKTRLESWGLDSDVVRHIPLCTDSSDQELVWYRRERVDALFDTNTVGLVLVDGPTSASGPHVRRAAVDYMKGYLADDAVVVLDDYQRREEREIVDMWAKQFPEAEVDVLPGQKEKEIAIFQLKQSRGS